MKTRLTRGTTNQVFHRLFSKQKRKDYIWAMNLKPGDGINSYDAWNHVVKSVKICWSTVPPRLKFKNDDMLFGLCPSGTFVQDVEITSTNGWLHCISESGCIEPAWTIKQIRDHHCLCYETTSVVDKMIELGIVDENGYRLRSSTEEESKIINKFTINGEK